MSEHELWNELGNLYFMSSAYPQAVYAYNRSIQLDHGFGRPYSNLALTYVQQGKYEEAVELFRTGIHLLLDDREKASSWSQLGTVYRHMKDYDQAIEAYQKADELDPENSVHRESSAQLLYGGSSSNEADLAALKQEMEDGGWEVMLPGEGNNPPQHKTELPYSEDAFDSAWMDRDLGERPFLPQQAEDGIEIHALGKASDQLEERLRVSAEVEPVEETSTHGPTIREGLSSKSAEPHEAVTNSFPPMISKDARFSNTGEFASETYSTAVVNVAEAIPLPSFLVLKGEDAQAEAKTTRVQDGSVTHDRLTAIPDQKEIEVGLARYKRVVQVNPKNAAAWDMLGNLYKSAGMYKDAVIAYQQAVRVEPGRGIYYHHLGLVCAAERRDADAISAFQRVIELEPEHGLAHAALGGYYRKMGLEELAQEHIGKAMRIIYDSENEYNRACLEAICGNVDQALELLRAALDNKQTYVDWVIRDPDLDFIRKDPRFSKLISEYSK